VLGTEGFGVLTLHRPSNVDDPEALLRLIVLLEDLATRLPIVFPVHPRTAGRLREFGLWARLADSDRLILCQPLGYGDLLSLTTAARVVLTDSGGIQEECCVAGTPCITLRSSTERPATLVEHGGTNHLVGTDVEDIRKAFDLALASRRTPHRPPLWDGHTAPRILARLLDEPPRARLPHGAYPP
jgi:UDP-N-acetylglucosamine 2-epimerase (non-hydrolysing)